MINKINIIIFWLVQCLPFVKRIFFWSDPLYFFFNYLPALLALRVRIELRVFLIYMVICIFLVGGKIDQDIALLYLVGLMPFLCRSQFNITFSQLFQRYWLIPLLIILYGIYQKIFGYSPFEMGWIRSGKGKVGEEGLFLSGDIRPFSFFAGIPEYSFFMCILIYHEIFIRQKKITSICLILLLLLMGSRGVIMGLAIALIIALFGGKIPKILRFIIATGVAVGTYFILINLADILWLYEGEGNRMLVYGTFNARFEIVSKFLEESTFSDMIFGVGIPFQTFDNMYISILNDFGLIGIILLFYLLYSVTRSHKAEFAIHITLVFGLFSDFVHSFFFMHLLAMMIYSKSNPIAQKFQLGHRVFLSNLTMAKVSR